MGLQDQQATHAPAPAVHGRSRERRRLRAASDGERHEYSEGGHALEAKVGNASGAQEALFRPIWKYGLDERQQPAKDSGCHGCEAKLAQKRIVPDKSAPNERLASELGKENERKQSISKLKHELDSSRTK